MAGHPVRHPALRANEAWSATMATTRTNRQKQRETNRDRQTVSLLVLWWMVPAGLFVSTTTCCSAFVVLRGWKSRACESRKRWWTTARRRSGGAQEVAGHPLPNVPCSEVQQHDQQSLVLEIPTEAKQTPVDVHLVQTQKLDRRPYDVHDGVLPLNRWHQRQPTPPARRRSLSTAGLQQVAKTKVRGEQLPPENPPSPALENEVGHGRASPQVSDKQKGNMPYEAAQAPARDRRGHQAVDGTRERERERQGERYGDREGVEWSGVEQHAS